MATYNTQELNDSSRNVSTRKYADLDLFFGRKNSNSDVQDITNVKAVKRSIRNLVHKFQIKNAYSPPKRYSGSCLDGRDITYNIVPDADFKFFITANVKIRALRRYKELRQLNMKISYKEVLKSIELRDKRDYSRKIAPLKKTKDSILINTTNLSKRACFLKIKKIIDKKLKVNGNI